MANGLYPVAGATLTAPAYPLAPASVYPVAADPRESIIGSIVKEIGRDIGGGFNVASATIGEFAGLLGLAAPLTYEDLTTRDVKGAMMLAALGAGGLIGNAARGLPMVAGLAGRGAVGRAAAFSMAEATAGAAVGMIRPLEEDENRLRAVFGDAAFSGAFGAGLSFSRSAWMATLGGRVAAVKQQAALQRMGQALQHSESENFVRESAGIVLLNPTTGARQTVRRLEDGSIQRTLIDSSGATTSTTQGDFGGSLAEAVQAGFTESLGVNRRQFQRSLTGKVDEATLELLKGTEFDVSAALGPMRISEYAAVREAGLALREAGQELGSLAGEVLAPTKGLGVPSLPANARATLLKELKLPATLADGDLLRAGFRAGLITVDTAKAGIDLDRYTKDLFLSNMVPEVPIIVSNFTDAVGTSLLLPRRLAQLFPAFSPIYQDADRRLAMLDDSKMAFDNWLSSLRQTVGPAKARLAVNIIDESANAAPDAAAARLAAMQAAQATGDQEVITFVEQATGKLEEYLGRAQALGIVDEGISGYFPMVVANKWKLDITGISKEDLAATGVKLFYSKKAQAIQAAEQLIAKRPPVPITPANQTRLAAARAQGFDVDTPYYHGTPTTFDEFGQGKYPGEVVPEGIWLTKDPKEASHFAGSEADIKYGATPQIRPVFIRPDRIIHSDKAAGTIIVAPENIRSQFDLFGVKDAAPTINYTVSPQSFWHPEEIFKVGAEGVDGVEKAYRRAFGRPPLKSTPFAKQRTLGIRDFSEDPYTALELYGSSMERAIALRDFGRTVQPFIDAIPDSQPRLKAAASQYVADILGKPRPQEEAFQAVLEHIGYDAPPRALKKYTSAIRKWEAAFRLGGPFSAIVNMTQVALNTVPLLGVKDTALGFEVLSSPAAWKRAQETLHRNGLSLGHFIPFTDEGQMIAAFGSPKSALKERRYVEAMHRMSLSLFYGAEKTNRLVTAWGAFKAGLRQFDGDEKAAAGYAQEILERAQFNYRLSNTPDLLRSPAGALLLQFKSFVINEVDFIASLNRQEALRFGAAVWGLGGLALFMNMPGTDVVNLASTAFFDRKIDEAAALHADDGLAQRGFLFGLPGLVNIDMSDYVGVGAVNEIAGGVLGPAAADAGHLYNFIKNAAVDIKSNGFVSTNTSTAFVQATAPSAIRRAMRGYDIFQTGEVANPYTGKLVYRPANRLRAAVQQTIGFPELEMTQQRAADAITTRVRDSYIRGRTTFAKEAAQAIREGNAAEAQRVMQEAQASGFELDQRTIRYWTKELGRTAADRRLRRTPQALRQEYAELFEATGTLELGL